MYAEAMVAAMKEAAAAERQGEIPVGAIILCSGKVLVSAHNERETRRDPTAHAEILAIQEAAKKLGRRRLWGCTLVVTLEPCAMCAGAALAAGVDRIVFGARDAERGCAGSVYALPEDPALGQISCIGGLMEGESEKLLNGFFEKMRKNEREQ